MAGSADRIQVDIRGDVSKAVKIRTALAAIPTIKTESGTEVEVVVLSESAVAVDEHPLVVLGPDDEEAMLTAIEEGAMGYVLTSATIEDIEAALETVAGGVAVIPPMMLGSLLRHTVRRRRAADEVSRRLAVLTDREREVLEELALGKQRRDIAHRLFISPETVRTHIQRAMSKLGVHSQNELMALLAPRDQGNP